MKERVTPSPGDLSDLLAAGTREVHQKSENTQFVKDFLKGRIHIELFKLGTVALYYVYTAMEEEMEKNKHHPQFAPLYFPTKLHRHKSLTRDLEFLYGPDWQSQVSCSPATQQYVARIHQAGQEDPVLLVAHAYTRQMGDLSGGQVLKKVAQRALKLPPTGEGLAFYQFDCIHSIKAFKQLYRSRMNELALDSETKQRLVAEAVRAFKFNIEVFEELEEIRKTIQEGILKNTDMHVHGSAHGAFNNCPHFRASCGTASDMQVHGSVHGEVNNFRKTIQEGIFKNSDMHVHGSAHGAVNNCPYFRASCGTAYAYAYACQLAIASLRHPTGQVLISAWVAALAGLAAWYLM